MYVHIESEVLLKSGSEPVLVRLEYYWNIRVSGNVTLCRCCYISGSSEAFNPLNAELNPICHLLALLGAHPVLHIGRITVK
jgi:hypothetical protein